MCSVKKFFVADVNLIGEEDIAAIRYTLSFKKLLKTFTGLIWVLSIAKITIEIKIKTNKENFCLAPLCNSAERIAIPKSSLLVAIV